jgi:hypothetical protein
MASAISRITDFALRSYTVKLAWDPGLPPFIGVEPVTRSCGLSKGECLGDRPIGREFAEARVSGNARKDWLRGANSGRAGLLRVIRR